MAATPRQICLCKPLSAILRGFGAPRGVFMGHLNYIHIYDATGREVLLRVAYRLLARYLRSNKPGNSAQSVNCIRLAASQLSAGGFPQLALRLLGLHAAIEAGLTSRQYLHQEIRSYRIGALHERRRLLPDYKANRNPTPRVTNRGGQHRDVWADPLNNATLPDDLARGYYDGD